MKKFTFFICFLFLSLIKLSAQKYPFKSYTIKDGLPQSSIYSFYKDKQGYLWLATESGLCRFNGIDFKNYTTKDGLPDIYIRDLVPLFNGNILIATGWGGLSIFDGKSFFNTNKLFDLGSEINSLTNNHDQSILINTKEKGCFEAFSNPPYCRKVNFPNHIKHIKKAVKTRKNEYFAITLDGLYKLENNKAKLIDTALYSDIYYTSGDTIFLGGQNVLKYYFNNALFNFPILETDFHIRNIERNNDDLLLCTDLGFNVLNLKNYTIQTYNVNSGITNNEVISVHIDNNIIIGTRSGGFTILNSRGLEFFSEYENIDNLFATAFFSNDSALYFSTYLNGLFKYRYNTQKIESVKANMKNTYCLNIFKMKNNPNLFTYNFYTSTVIEFNDDKIIQSYPFNFIYIYHAESFEEKMIHLGTSNGFFSFNIETKKLTNLFPNFENEVMYLFQDNEKNIWLLCKNGEIYSYNSKKIINYSTNINPQKFYLYQGLYDNRLSHYIFATNHGMILYKKNNAPLLINEKQGLRSNTIWSITIDKKGNYWCGHEKGVDCILIKSNTIKHYGYNQGFLPIETMSTAAHTDKAGNVWFGGLNSVAKFKQDVIDIDKKINKPIIERILINGEESYLSTINSNQPADLKLKYNENNLKIDFITIDYIEGKELRYAYFLENYDKQWGEINSYRQANYTNLDPGEYILKIKSFNSEGISSDETIIYIQISKPFWKKAWFYILEICFFVALLFLSFAFNKNEKQRRISNVITLLTIFIVFESFLIYFSKYTDKWTNGIPIFQLIMNLFLAVSLHSIENFIMKKMSNIRNKKQ